MRRRLIAAALVLLTGIVATVGIASGRMAPSLSTAVEGDTELAQQVSAIAGGARDRLSVCVVADGEQQIASFGADSQTVYPIASLTKTVTGELLALALNFGEVRTDTPIGNLLPLAGSEAADLTVIELANHTSGLSEWGPDQAREQTWWDTNVRDGSVPEADLEQILQSAREDPLATRGTYSYSNIGFALLGHALAAAAETDYETLVRERILDPWQMADTIATEQPLANPPAGHSPAGFHTEAPSLGAYLPSGGIYSTIADMCDYVTNLLNFSETFPDAVNARDPIESADGSVSGLGWTHEQVGEAYIAVKSGKIPGFTATIAMTEEMGVVVLSDTATPVDTIALKLIEDRL